jgi:restriction system protein
MKRRTVKEAVIETFKRKQIPLTIKEVYQFIIANDLYRFNAGNPENIVRTEIRRHCEGVEFPTAKSNKLFQRANNGTYWLKDVPVPDADLATPVFTKPSSESHNLKTIISDLKEIHQKHAQAFKEEVLNQLKQIDPRLFEVFSKKLLEVYGFTEVNVTDYVRDGGIDGYGKLKVGLTYLNVAFQCKRWKSNVSRTEIDKFRGAIQGMYEQGIIFTTSNFSKDAQGATRRQGAVPIILIDGNTLVDIMVDKKFGVKLEYIPVYVNALDDALL